MKKVVTFVLIATLSIGSSFASTGLGDKKEAKKDSAEIVKTESVFQTSFDQVNKQVEVVFSGIQDPTAIVSLTNQRGTSIQSTVVKNESDILTFDATQLKAGIYNVMLITDQEIRIKRVVIE